MANTRSKRSKRIRKERKNCERSGCKNKSQEVHHAVDGSNLDADLQALCTACHVEGHKNDKGRHWIGIPVTAH
jgi:hypothetical protein